MSTRSKIIVVSTRLPASLERDEDGTLRSKPSPGGLATAMRSVAEHHPFTWVGWPGVEIPPEEHAAAERLLRDEHGVIPVFLDQETYHGFYEEFANRLLWPLFHGFTELRYDTVAWPAYQEANRRFADAVAKLAEPGDLIWVHDYQLMLLPSMLRARCPDCTIGFFLHIPFPASETYRRLPQRETILRGLLGAHLVAFHSYEYVWNFRTACMRVLGLESEPEAIRLPTHTTRMRALPIGIDPEELRVLGETDEAAEELALLRERHKDHVVLAGVDRLDYTKGIPEKLEAFGRVLERRPDLREKLVLVQVAAPSRQGVLEYQQLKRRVDELAGRINSGMGTTGNTPLVYINQTVSRARLSALFRVADVALVTAIRDGMNLVAMEYVAARQEPGTLVLSEFAGVASCLPGAALVNPHDIEQVAREIEAVADGRRPTETQYAEMRQFVERNTAMRWAERFIALLRDAAETATPGPERFSMARAEVYGALSSARRPLLLLDYDGTLTEHVPVPADARPKQPLLDLLADLTEVATVYVISGRSRADLEAWLGALPVGLVCEHGLTWRAPGGEWQQVELPDETVVHEHVLPVLSDFVEQTPGATIERKTACVAWHYRNADLALGTWRARELRLLLEERLANTGFAVLIGSRVVEVRPRDINKGRAARAILDAHSDADIIVAVGNDRTDEDMFESVRAESERRAITCRVGSRHTQAEFFLETPAELLEALARIHDLWRPLQR